MLSTGSQGWEGNSRLGGDLVFSAFTPPPSCSATQNLLKRGASFKMQIASVLLSE